MLLLYYILNNMFEIYIETYDKTSSIIVNESDSIYTIKKKIQKKHKIDANKQMLLYNEMLLEDHKTLYDYGINETSKLCFFMTFLLPIRLYSKL